MAMLLDEVDALDVGAGHRSAGPGPMRLEAETEAVVAIGMWLVGRRPSKHKDACPDCEGGIQYEDTCGLCSQAIARPCPTCGGNGRV